MLFMRDHVQCTLTPFYHHHAACVLSSRMLSVTAGPVLLRETTNPRAPSTHLFLYTLTLCHLCVRVCLLLAGARGPNPS